MRQIQSSAADVVYERSEVVPRLLEGLAAKTVWRQPIDFSVACTDIGVLCRVTFGAVYSLRCTLSPNGLDNSVWRSAPAIVTAHDHPPDGHSAAQPSAASLC